MVEFALVIPILLTMILGIFEFGRVMWIYTSVTSASREATRYGLVQGDSGGGTPYSLDCTGIRETAKAIGWPGNVQDADVTITYDTGPSTSLIGTCPSAPATIILGDRITVQVVGHFTPGGYIPLFQLPAFDLTSASSRTFLTDVDVGP